MTVLAESGRATLLTAGMVVAEREGLQRLSINAVVEEAGMAKGTFYRHFANRHTYLVALYRQFFTLISARVAEAIRDMPPGPDRLAVSVDAFLDACLHSCGTEAFMLQAQSDPGLRTEIVQRREGFLAASRPDMVAVGWSDPDAASMLKVAMVREICIAELDTRAPRTDLRAAAKAMLGGRPPR